MEIFQGRAVASGIAIGKICVYSAEGEGDVPHYSIDSDSVAFEKQRAGNAILRARDVMLAMVERASGSLEPHLAEIFHMHYAVLEEKWVLESVEAYIDEHLVNAEHAVVDVFQTFIDKYSSQIGHFADFAQDLNDIRDRILECFEDSSSSGFACPTGASSPVIIAAHALVPSLVLNVNPENVLAFVSMEGGVTTHATILARSLGVPIIFGIPVARYLHCGDQVIVDGSLGRVFVNPSTDVSSYYEEKARSLAAVRIKCESFANEPIITPSGRDLSLKINISFPEELVLAENVPHQGIGLLRTEFMMFHRDSPPSEHEIASQLRDVMNQVECDIDGNHRPVTVRTLDISSDKLPPYMELPHQINPDLGIRGARAVEYFPEIYHAQFKAFWRVNEPGRFRVLFPMVSDLADLMVFRSALDRAAAELESEGVEFHRQMTQGIMIETPSAALMIDQLLEYVDFVNIGSNDLNQYTLASTRGDAATEGRYHIFHPSIAKLIEMVARAGQSNSKEVCLCGEISYFEEFYPLILALGIESVSISVSKLKDIKCYLHGLDVMDEKGVESMLRKFYCLSLKDEVDGFFKAFYSNTLSA
jgi:phosphotransferase system enzyme I (PtsI)